MAASMMVGRPIKRFAADSCTIWLVGCSEYAVLVLSGNVLPCQYFAFEIMSATKHLQIHCSVESFSNLAQRLHMIQALFLMHLQLMFICFHKNRRCPHVECH
jgi:hypothetical protein